MINSLSKPKICLISHNSYGLLSNRFDKHIGGVEIQTALVSKWLANNGYEVSVLVWDEGGEKIEEIDGVKVIKLCRKDEGLPLVRFFYPRWASLISGLKKSNADIFYHNCAEYVTGQIALWCKIKKKKFVYSVASEPECDPNLPDMHSRREKYLYKYGIKTADLRFVQNEKQKIMLSKGFGLDSTILNMPCDGPVANNYKHQYITNKPEKISILWVGRISPVKRPELLLQLADKFEEVEFQLVGGQDQDVNYANSIIENAKKRNNVKIIGKVGKEKLSEYYKNSYILCSTSLFEGLPNVFLESWSFGLPVISTFDPNNMIKENGLGWHCETINELEGIIKKIICDHDLWRKRSINSREYFIKNHSVGETMQKFSTLIMELIKTE